VLLASVLLAEVAYQESITHTDRIELRDGLELRGRLESRDSIELRGKCTAGAATRDTTR